MHIIISGHRNRQSGIDADIEPNFITVLILICYAAHEIALISNIINSQRCSVFTFQRVLTVSIPLILQSVLVSGMGNHFQRDASTRFDRKICGSAHCFQSKIIINTYTGAKIIRFAIRLFCDMALIIRIICCLHLQRNVRLVLDFFPIFEPLIGEASFAACHIIINNSCQCNGFAVCHAIVWRAFNVRGEIFINLNIVVCKKRMSVSIADVALVLSVLLRIERISIRAFDPTAVI